MAKISKAKAWKFLKINAEEFCELLELGNSEHVSKETLENVRLCFCMLYDTKTETSDINYLRYHLFCRKQAKNEALPPTDDSLDLHTMRCNFQTLIWKNALVPMFDIPSPVDKGWYLDEDEMLRPKLMKKDPASQSLIETITCGCKTSKCSKRCSCSSEVLACTESCLCGGGEDCMNPQNLTSTIDDSDSSGSESDTE